MTTAPLSKFDLMAPPVVKTIQQRSLIIGVIFSLIAVAGALVLKQPDEFFRA